VSVSTTITSDARLDYKCLYPFYVMCPPNILMFDLERPLKLGQIATSCRDPYLSRLGAPSKGLQRSSLAIGIARVRPLSDQHKYDYKRYMPKSALMQNKQYYIIYTHPSPRVYRGSGAPVLLWWLGDGRRFRMMYKENPTIYRMARSQPTATLAPSAASRLCNPLRCRGCEGGTKQKMNPVHRHKIRLICTRPVVVCPLLQSKR